MDDNLKRRLDELFGETKLDIDSSRSKNKINLQTQIDFTKPKMVIKPDPATLGIYVEWED